VRIPGWEKEYPGNSRLHKGNIFPARKILVSDIPAGSREMDWNIFTVYL